MKIKLILFAILVGAFLSANSQQVVSYQLIQSYNETQVDSLLLANNIPLFIIPSRFGVKIYHVIYNTVSHDSTASIASGALIVPDSPPCPMPLISYLHGTIFKKLEVPSRNYGEIIIGVAMATDGYAVAMPDYIGLGDSPVPVHPYVHANSEASASVDMLRACKEIIVDSLSFGLNSQLFIVGYSQGGHAAMALQRLIETSLSSEFSITASAPMSGPYDISGVQAAVITNDSVFSQPAFLPYVVFSMNEVYSLFLNDSDVFIHPYDTLLFPLFDGYHSSGDVNAVMPVIPNDVLHQAVLDSFRTDTNHYFRVALRDNDVYDWTPMRPTRLYYCNADEQVYYTNAIVAHDKMVANGSTSVGLVQISQTLGHVDCARIALIVGKAWFDSLRVDLPEVNFSVSHASSATSADGQLLAIASGGVAPYQFLWSNGSTTNPNTGLLPGMYYITVTDANGCMVTDSMVVGISTAFAESEYMDRIVNVYPNPADDYIVASYENFHSKNVSVELLDADGKKISCSVLHLRNKIAIDLAGIRSGSYFIVIQLDGNKITKKIAVE